MIVSQADLRSLTGYVRGSAQARWLRRHGFRFTINALGSPVVALAEFNRQLVGGKASQQEPNFEVLHGPTSHAR